MWHFVYQMDIKIALQMVWINGVLQNRLQFPKIPLQAAVTGEPRVTPSLFNLIHPGLGGNQKTSVTIGAFEGFKTTPKLFF